MLGRETKKFVVPRLQRLAFDVVEAMKLVARGDALGGVVKQYRGKAGCLHQLADIRRC